LLLLNGPYKNAATRTVTIATVHIKMVLDQIFAGPAPRNPSHHHLGIEALPTLHVGARLCLAPLKPCQRRRVNGGDEMHMHRKPENQAQPEYSRASHFASGLFWTKKISQYNLFYAIAATAGTITGKY